LTIWNIKKFRLKIRRLKMKKIERAIISVTDKAGIVEFSRDLSGMGVEILSTGGTAKAIREGGVNATDISEYTGFPEMLDGRVKTLHPKVHGGLLGVRSNQEHVRVMKENGIYNIDLVVVDAIENIDIGGPAMLRSSAKNFQDVTVVVDPSDYEEVLREMRKNDGGTLLKTRFRLAKKVFNLTHKYDGAISKYLEGVEI
jgi:phosphoribosylaminoimidazolecarboxamide formyltransferase / IMP cyclohydrolase